MRSSADSSSTAGKQSRCAVQPSPRGRAGQPRKPAHAPQGRPNKCTMPKTASSSLQAGAASSSADKLAASLISLKASPDLVQAFLRTQSGKLMEHISLFKQMYCIFYSAVALLLADSKAYCAPHKEKHTLPMARKCLNDSVQLESRQSRPAFVGSSQNPKLPLRGHLNNPCRLPAIHQDGDLG